LQYHFFAIFKVSRPVAFETETRKNGSRDESRDRDQVSRLHHCHNQIMDCSQSEHRYVYNMPKANETADPFWFCPNSIVQRTKIVKNHPEQ